MAGSRPPDHLGRAAEIKRLQDQLGQLDREQRRYRVPMLLRDFLFLFLCLYLLFRFPLPGVPALVAAVIGWRLGSRRRPLIEDPDPIKQAQQRGVAVVHHTLLWGVAGGAVGYAFLAWLRVGIPAPEVAVGWRVAGGLALGALAGLGATGFVTTLAAALRRIRRPRAA